jgi:prevent-host-death family protein
VRKVNLYEAKTNLSRLVDEALGGEEVVIARAGKPLVRLVPCRAEDEPRKPGNEVIWIADDFDAPLDGELGAAFRGERP